MTAVCSVFQHYPTHSSCLPVKVCVCVCVGTRVCWNVYLCFTTIDSEFLYLLFKSFLYFKVSQSSYFVSGSFLSLTLWYCCRDLLLNMLVFLLLCQPCNKYLELSGTFHQSSVLENLLSLHLPTFLIQLSVFSRSLSLSLTLHCLLLPLLCLPVDKWTLCLLVKRT